MHVSPPPATPPRTRVLVSLRLRVSTVHLFLEEEEEENGMRKAETGRERARAERLPLNSTFLIRREQAAGL